MKKYQFILKNEKLKFYDRFAVFLFVLNAICVIWFFSFSSQTTLQQSTGGITLLLLLPTIFISLFSNKKSKARYYFLFATIGIALYWILLGFWWIGLIMVVLSVLYTISKKELIVEASTDQITYPSFPTKILTWVELNNMILKDGLLTIDLKSNKYIQQHVDQTRTFINEAEFNDFCREQLNK